MTAEGFAKSSPDKGRKYQAPRPKTKKKIVDPEDIQDLSVTFTDFRPAGRYAMHTDSSKVRMERTKTYVEDMLKDGHHPTLIRLKTVARSPSPVKKHPTVYLEMQEPKAMRKAGKQIAKSPVKK